MITVHVDDSGALGAFTIADGVIRDDTARVVFRTGARLRTQVRANASGRPGPRVQTGDYRRSISQTNGYDREVPVSTVFTTAPQGARLEYGFTGTDAAGRSFHQPAYPHWRPAAEQLRELFAKECAELTRRAIAALGGAR